MIPLNRKQIDDAIPKLGRAVAKYERIQSDPLRFGKRPKTLAAERAGEEKRTFLSDSETRFTSPICPFLVVS